MTTGPSLTVELAPGAKRNLTLANPVMVASGTFGYGDDQAKLFDIQRLGAIVTKTTTLSPRRGNPATRPRTMDSCRCTKSTRSICRAASWPC